MTKCKCEEHEVHVSDFTSVGVDVEKNQQVGGQQIVGNDVLALGLKACVSASYDASTNKICFSIPIYGNFCVTSPVTIPIGAEIKACAETCGRFIPTGLKVSIYLNGNSIWSGVVWGSC
jgi:hypothetical protein